LLYAATEDGAGRDGGCERTERRHLRVSGHAPNLTSVTFFDHPGPLVFAHRGGRALAPENTLLAFDTGLAAGADGLECDVRLSADGVPVVIHDETLDRTTDLTGPVRARTAAELARADAAARFEQDGRRPWQGQGVGIPTLAEVLRRYPDRRIVVEMKDHLPDLGTAVAAILRRDGGDLERLCIGGFGARPVEACRQALPGVTSSAHVREVRRALYASWMGWPVRSRAYGGYQVPETRGRLRVVSRRFIRAVHRAGHHVQVWTVNDEADMRRLLDWGVDALITDVPGVAATLVDARRATPGR
ncbi:MAG: glycerophosphodiester phosphodiesterase, partial [Vicinamibacterales bacterium]